MKMEPGHTNLQSKLHDQLNELNLKLLYVERGLKHIAFVKPENQFTVS